MANISLGHSLETLIEISESLLPTNKLRVFTGYSGWGAGQLEDEMLRKAWICHAADLNRVFAEEPDDMWREILREKGGLFQLLAQSPDDLSSN
jgi:putative transcriptional regulator